MGDEKNNTPATGNTTPVVVAATALPAVPVRDLTVATTVDDVKARESAAIIAQRWEMIKAIKGLFTSLNLAVIILVVFAMVLDNGLWWKVADGHKAIITEDVFKILIGATVVQAGVITVTIARFLFPTTTAAA